ncbi:MAG: DUF4190 domain-containing protein [Anaerolineae bacterium]|nr:DUF4190 domain-containing protein [Anaerolineae bacterium]
MNQQPPYAPSPPTNTLAIVSLVTAILSWLFFPILGAIVAIITGHMARREIQASYGAQSGDGLAMAGLIIGYLNLVLYCVFILIFVLIFGGMIGLSGCAILSESTNFNPAGLIIPPIPAG